MVMCDTGAKYSFQYNDNGHLFKISSHNADHKFKYEINSFKIKTTYSLQDNNYIRHFDFSEHLTRIKFPSTALSINYSREVTKMIILNKL